MGGIGQSVGTASIAAGEPAAVRKLLCGQRAVRRPHGTALATGNQIGFPLPDLPSG